LEYEDLNAHNARRDSVLFQTGVDRAERLAGYFALYRFEQVADREAAWAMHGVLVK